MTLVSLSLLALRQTLFFSIYLLMLPVAGLLLVPLGWVTVWHQQACLVGGSENPVLPDLWRKAWRDVFLWQTSYHVALMVASAVLIFVFLNVYAFVFVGPMLTKMITGIESAITRSYWVLFNSTVFFSVCFVSYAAVSPLLRAMFVLRSYSVASQSSGADLRDSLARINQARLARLVLCLGVLCFGATRSLMAQEVASSQEIGEAIEDVMERPEFSWRMTTDRTEGTGEGLLSRWMRKGMGILEDWIAALIDYLMPEREDSPNGKLFDFAGTSKPILIGLLIVVVVLLGRLFFRLVQRSRLTENEAPTVVDSATVPSLDSEKTLASDFPEDEWLALAHSLLNEGDYRRALRAFYLSALAHLHGQRLIHVTRSKSNATYLAEIRRFQHQLPSLAEHFRVVVVNFDRVWYGYHTVDRESLHNYERFVGEIRGSRRE